MTDLLNELDNELDSMSQNISKIKNENSNTKRRIKINKKSDNKIVYREKFISKFPDTKFYLPTLRDGYTRYMPIG
jgi:predicted RNase H-like nuclease (RuvC/YqgF family)